MKKEIMGEIVRSDLCMKCGEETKFKVITKEKEICVRGEPIEVVFQYCKCDVCGDEIVDPEYNVDSFKLAYIEYRKRHGFLQPDEIKEWRKTRDIKQSELAKLIGLGATTLSRYENGALQDEAHDKLLSLVMEDENFAQLVQESEDVFTSAKKEKLLKQFQNEATNVNSNNRIIINLHRYEPCEFSGYKRFDLPRLRSAVLFFASEGVFKTKLNKMLFYADFKHFKEYALSITGIEYAHLPYGPVPNNFEMYYAMLCSGKGIDIQEEYVGDCVGERIYALEKPELTLFSVTELKILAEVKEYFSKFSANDLKNFSHTEVGYERTRDGELISYHYANQLKI